MCSDKTLNYDCAKLSCQNEYATKSYKKILRWALCITYCRLQSIFNLSSANRAAKQYRLVSIIKVATIINANTQVHSVCLQNVSRCWTVQAVVRLKICTMWTNSLLQCFFKVFLGTQTVSQIPPTVSQNITNFCNYGREFKVDSMSR